MQSLRPVGLNAATDAIMSIVSTGHGDGQAALPSSILALTEQLVGLEELRAPQQQASRKNIKRLELNVALRVRLGIRGKEHACMLVLEDLVRMCCELVMRSMGDRTFARSLLEKADRLTNEIKPPSDHAVQWAKLRVMALNGLAHFNKQYGRPHAALRCFDAAGKLLVRLGGAVEADEVAGTHLNICVMLSTLRKHKLALQHAQAALELLRAGTGLPEGWDPIHEVAALQLLPPAKRAAAAMLTIAYHNIGVQLEALELHPEAHSAMQAAAALGAASASWEDRPVTRMREEITHHAHDLAGNAGAMGSTGAGFFPQGAPPNMPTQLLPPLNARFDGSPLLCPVGFGGYQNGVKARKRQRRRKGQRQRQRFQSTAGMSMGDFDAQSGGANATAPPSMFAQVQPIDSSGDTLNDDYYFYSNFGGGGTRQERTDLPVQPPRPTSLPSLEFGGGSNGGGRHGAYPRIPPSQPHGRQQADRGQNRRAAVTRIQAVHRGKAGRRRVQAVRAAKAEEHAVVMTGADEIETWVRRSWQGAKEDAERSAAEWEAEARRVFIAFDSNRDRRIDQEELGQLLQSLITRQTGATLSRAALEYAASLWMGKGDIDRDGSLDADEFVKLYLRLCNSPMLLHSAAGKVAEVEDSATVKIQAIQRGKSEREILRKRGRAAWRQFRAEAADLAADPTMQQEAEAIFKSYAATTGGGAAGGQRGGGDEESCGVAQADIGAVMAAITEELYGVIISASSMQFAAGIMDGGGSGSGHGGGLVPFGPFYQRYATLLASPLVAGAAGWAKASPQPTTTTSVGDGDGDGGSGSGGSPVSPVAAVAPSPSRETAAAAAPAPAPAAPTDASGDGEGMAELAQSSFELGSSLISSQDYSGARTAFISALKLGHGAPARCRNGAGIAAALEGKQDEAIAHFTAALELVPLDARTLHNRAQAYRATGRWKQAEADAKAAVAADEADGGGDASASLRLAEDTEMEKAAAILQTLQRGRIARKLWNQTLRDMKMKKVAQLAQAAKSGCAVDKTETSDQP